MPLDVSIESCEIPLQRRQEEGGGGGGGGGVVARSCCSQLECDSLFEGRGILGASPDSLGILGVFWS